MPRWAPAPGLDDEVIASKLLGELDADEIRPTLLALLAGMVATERRSIVRDIEYRAEQAGRRAAQQAEWAALDVERAAEKTAREAYWREHPSAAHANSRIYKEWVATTPEGAAREERRLAEKAERADRERLRQEDPAAYDAKYGMTAILRRMREIQEQFERDLREEVRLELLDELLAAPFALGDGTTVTWGSETVADTSAVSNSKPATSRATSPTCAAMWRPCG